MVSAVGATGEQVGRTDIRGDSHHGSPHARELTRVFQEVADGSLEVPVANTYRLKSATQALADFSQP